MVPGRPAVAVSERQQPGVNVIFLYPFLPAPVKSRGVGVRIIVITKINQSSGTVNSLPVESVIRERLRPAIRPKDLGDNEIADATAFHNLGQCSGITENIRKPKQFIIDVKLSLEKLFPVDKA
jgi:hypothetical protein